MSLVIDCIFGGPDGIRTHDQRIKSPLLYQLSYRTILPMQPIENNTFCSLCQEFSS
jgi:hypothetical protein